MSNLNKRNTHRSEISEVIIHWIPELILFPVKLVLMAIKGTGRVIRSIFDLV